MGQLHGKKKIEKGLSSQKQRTIGLKDLKPKIHEGAGFRAHETKGRKKKRPSLPRLEDQKESSRKNWAGIPETAKGPRSLGCATQPKWE